MDISTQGKIIIAIEVRRSCFGYAVFEGSACLLDWGATTPYPLAGSIRRAEKRILFLFGLLPPAAIVVRRPCMPISRGLILGLLKREAARRSLPVEILNRDDILKAFSPNRLRNKYKVAVALTQIFPDLVFKLPPQRGTGDSERRAMIVFDAIATGYAYLQTPQIQSPPAGD